MGIPFINGGEIGGNTAHLSHAFLEGRDFTQIDLASLKVYDYGTHFADDQFDEVLDAMKTADTIVIGSPVYWHDMSGMTCCLLDRCYGPVSTDDLAGKRLFFLFQGGAPTQQMYERANTPSAVSPVCTAWSTWAWLAMRARRTHSPPSCDHIPLFRDLPADSHIANAICAGVSYHSPLPKAISPGSSNSPAWTAAESSQSRSTANMVLPLHAGCTSITDPCENVKPCVPAISVVPSKDGLPRRPSLIHVPSAMWWRCGVRSRSWRPVKSAALGPDSTRPWGRRPHVLREKPEIPRKPHMLRRAADSRHDRAAHTVPSRARAAARRTRRTERRSERGNGSSYARRRACHRPPSSPRRCRG